MAEANEALSLEYDEYNDVLHVFATPDPGSAIAVPGAGLTVLVSEDLDQVVGLVFENLTALAMVGVLKHPELSVDDDPDTRRKFAVSLIEGIAPSIMSGSLPVAKDRIRTWLELLDESRRQRQLGTTD